MLSFVSRYGSSKGFGCQKKSVSTRVLEAGIGKGELLRYLSAHAADSPTDHDRFRLHGFDIKDVAPAVARLKTEFPETSWDDVVRHSPDGTWPFSNSSFDIVVSNQVLEHVEDLDGFFSECFRILRPGGFAIHVFPTRRMLVEPHLLVPMVHHVKSERMQIAVLRTLYGLGLMKGGPWAKRHAERDIDYLQRATFYRTWRDVAAQATAAGFDAVPLHSLCYFGLPVCRNNQAHRLNFIKQRHRDVVSISVAQWLIPVTLLLRRTQDP